MKHTILPILLICLCLAACTKEDDPVNPPEETKEIQLLDSIGWCWAKDCPEDLSSASCVVATDTAIKLEFYGWSFDKDRRFQLQMPAEGNFRRVIMEYTMTTWNEGCSSWDMVTEISICNPVDSQWYELQRAITPYGGSFNAGWEKKFYMDVTHLLPLMQHADPTDFKIYYCGFDASATRAHAVKLAFYFFEGDNQYGTPTYHAKVYDSFSNGNNGYRAWAYGIDTASIEDPERLGDRTIQLPAGTKRALLRVCFTGHGQERSTSQSEQGHSYQGYFPGRGTSAVNPAEFDQNWYTLYVNGKAHDQRGYIWENNSSNYHQNGTYQASRAGWGPGKPANTHYWMLNNIPDDGLITINMDLDPYVSNCTYPKAAYVANYYVTAEIFAFE